MNGQRLIKSEGLRTWIVFIGLMVFQLVMVDQGYSQNYLEEGVDQFEEGMTSVYRILSIFFGVVSVLALATAVWAYATGNQGAKDKIVVVIIVMILSGIGSFMLGNLS